MAQTFAPLPDRKAWLALSAVVIGFFMILVDQTIVAVASEALGEDLGATENQIIWVTSAYLLAFAVPLLFTGRLGDQIGPKKATILGLVIFTGASLWCGLSGSIGMLIVARVVQGFGAALVSPALADRLRPVENKPEKSQRFFTDLRSEPGHANSPYGVAAFASNATSTSALTFLSPSATCSATCST